MTLKTFALVATPASVLLGSSVVNVTMSGGLLSNGGVGVRAGAPVQWSFSAPVAIVGMTLVAFELGEVARLNASASVANARLRSSEDDTPPTLDVRDAVSVFSTFENGFYVYTLEALDQAVFDVAAIDVESPRAGEPPTVAMSATTTVNQPILIDDGDDTSDDGTGLMIGFVVGGVLLLLLIAAAVIFVVVRKRRRVTSDGIASDATVSGVSEPPTLPRMPTASGTDIYGTFPADPVTARMHTIPPQYDSVASLRHTSQPMHSYGKAPVAPTSALYDAVDTPL